MRNLIGTIRQRFHPFYHARRTRIGRLAIRLCDVPVWLSVPRITFKVRGRALTHGLAFAATGSQETGPEALSIACMKRFRFRSFWDVGANIGHYTWLMKSAADAEIEAVIFEPLPDNASLIRSTLERNKFRNTVFIQAAASDSPGEGVLRSDTLAGATSTLESTEGTFEERHFGIPSKGVAIQLVSIDSVRTKFGPIDFMKIDVEGHEPSVLRGAWSTIESDQPILLIECCHPEHACLKPLEAFGYVLLNADTISLDLGPPGINFLCVPARLSQQVDNLLREARQIERELGA